MAYSSRENRNGDRRSSRSRRSSRKRQTTHRTTSQPAQPQSRRGTLTRPDTGYSLHSRRVRRDPNSNPLSMLLRPRVLLLVLILVVVAIVLVVNISSCIRRNNESASQAVEEAKPKNEQDERVAVGVSAAMTSKFTEALDRNDAFAQIAQNADQYTDERLLNLALEEPDAIAFVAAYPTSDKSSHTYDGDVSRGEVPRLYDWDDHWGAMNYGDGPLAVTGSGPTTLAMAYMGLTGKTDYTPVEIAQQASKSDYAEGDSGSKKGVFSKLPATMGLVSESAEVSAETLLYSLGDNTVIAAEVKADTLTKDAHWVLVVNVNADGSVTVFDPTSSSVSSRPWAASTIADSSSAFYTISASNATLEEIESSSKSSKKNTKDQTGSTTTTTSTDDDTSSSHYVFDD